MGKVGFLFLELVFYPCSKLKPKFHLARHVTSRHAI